MIDAGRIYFSMGASDMSRDHWDVKQLQKRFEEPHQGLVIMLHSHCRPLAKEHLNTGITGRKNSPTDSAVHSRQNWSHFTLGSSVSGGGVRTHPGRQGFPAVSFPANLCGDFGFGVCQMALSRRKLNPSGTAESSSVVGPGCAGMRCNLALVWNHSDLLARCLVLVNESQNWWVAAQ